MSNSKNEEAQALLSMALACYDRGNWVQAEHLCRLMLDRGLRHPVAYTLLGKVAAHVGETTRATRYFDQAGEINAEWEQDKLAAAQRPRYLLIKAWGYGFWSDIDHVLGALLVAEMTERVPIVCWGANSRYKAEGVANAFELYFEPVSQVRIEDLEGASDFYPPKWNRENLRADDVNKWDGPHSRMAGLQLLNRPEQVVVSDFHIYVNDMVPWIRDGHPFHGLSALQVYRHLFQRHIHLKPALAKAFDTLWQTNLADKHPALAVHIRGSDKVVEYPGLESFNQQYDGEIARFLGQLPAPHIFLMTDSQEILARYRERYAERLIYTQSIRSHSQAGVHYQGLPGEQLGMEILMDTYTAARCDYFLGCGHSNVSTTVHHLKDWMPGAYRLLGENSLLKRNLFLHDR